MTLVSHTNTARCTLEALRSAPIPEATRTWRPIGHYDLAVALKEQAQRSGLELKAEEYAMTSDRHRVFGVLDFTAASPSGEMARSIGFRHDNKKTLGLSLTIGARVFVCDNLCFSGDRVLYHKHSGVFDWRTMIPELFRNLDAAFINFDAAVNRLKETEVSKTEGRDLVIDTAKKGMIASCDIMPVINLWEEPPHPEFKPRNRWSLYNAFTEVAKKFQPQKRDESLRGLAEFFGMGQGAEIDAEIVPA